MVTPEERAAVHRAMPTRAIEAHPKKVPLVWTARRRPRESQGLEKSPGLLNSMATSRPAAVETSSQNVAERMKAEKRRACPSTGGGGTPPGGVGGKQTSQKTKYSPLCRRR